VLDVLRRHRDVRFVLAAQLLSALGSWLLILAAPYYVLQATHSAAASALAFAAESAPAVLVGPLAGVLVDRIDRRQAMIHADVARVGAVLLMLLALDPGQLWALFLGLAIESVFTQLAQPARSALLPQIVGRGADLSACNALAGAGLAAIGVGAAPLGGLLYAAFGFQAAVLADAASYGLSALLLLAVHPRGAAGLASDTRGWRGVADDVKAGGREIKNQPAVRSVTVTSCLFLLGNGTADALLVAYLGGRLHLPPSTLGLLFAGLGLASLLSAPFAGRFVDRLAPRALVTGALLAVSTSFAVLFNLPSMPVAAVVFMTLGPAVVAYTVAVDTLLQRATPDELLGRVLAGYRTATKTATLLGELGAVGLVTTFGLIVTLDVAVVAVALSAASALLLPANSLTTVRADTQAPRGDTTPFSGHSLQKDDRSNAVAVPFARAGSACPLLPAPARSCPLLPVPAAVEAPDARRLADR